MKKFLILVFSLVTTFTIFGYILSIFIDFNDLSNTDKIQISSSLITLLTVLVAYVAIYQNTVSLKYTHQSFALEHLKYLLQNAEQELSQIEISVEEILKTRLFLDKKISYNIDDSKKIKIFIKNNKLSSLENKISLYVNRYETYDKLLCDIKSTLGDNDSLYHSPYNVEKYKYFKNILDP